MAVKKKNYRKGKNESTVSTQNDFYYDKYSKIHLVASGAIVLCKATTVIGTTNTCLWNSKSNRDQIKANTLPDAEIIVEKNVPKDKGWDYGER